MQPSQEEIRKVAAYYAAQAPEYDEICGLDTEQQEARYARLKALYQRVFDGLDVLELACGTGYWTETLARTAKSVLATDVNVELVELSKKKLSSLPNVRYQVADAYTLEGVSGDFTAAFAHFWWSHVPKQRLRSFLEVLHSRLQSEALVWFADNMDYDAGLQRRVNEQGDIYEERILRDGKCFETIKNFPSEQEINESLRGVADDITYLQHQPENVWSVSYRVKRP